jgi:hypothetical protein
MCACTNCNPCTRGLLERKAVSQVVSAGEGTMHIMAWRTHICYESITAFLVITDMEMFSQTQRSVWWETRLISNADYI